MTNATFVMVVFFFVKLVRPKQQTQLSSWFFFCVASYETMTMSSVHHCGVFSIPQPITPRQQAQFVVLVFLMLHALTLLEIFGFATKI